MERFIYIFIAITFFLTILHKPHRGRIKTEQEKQDHNHMAHRKCVRCKVKSGKAKLGWLCYSCWDYLKDWT